MSPPPRSGFPSRAGVAAAALAALLAPADVGAQLPGPPPVPCVKLAPADSAAQDHFGCALAADGALAAVGSVQDDDLGSASGSIYLFTRSGGGWAQAAKLLASDGAAGDSLGFAVGVSGGRIAGGAPFRNEVGDTSGAVYLFTQRPNGGFAEAKLVPAGLGARDELGRSVAVSGVTVAAGAPGDDDRGSSAGAVWVWEVDPATGAPLSAQKLTAADGAAGDGFGNSVALAGGTLLAGAPYDDDGGAQAGSVYVFVRQGSSWVQAAKLTAADRRAGSLFGWSVAVRNGRAAIGARLDRTAAGPASGAVYVFQGAGGGWSQTAKLVPPGLTAGEELGVSVALAGDAVIGGANFGAVGGLPRAGAGYVFVEEPGGWAARYRLISPDPAAGDELGIAVGIGGGAVFAGIYLDDDAGADSGTMCVFELGGGLADLAVTKTDGVTVVDAGGSTTYTITVGNAGPAAVTGARVIDDFPATLEGCDWVCTGAGGAVCPASGAGDIDRLVDLPVGGTATLVAACTVAEFAAGTISNTAIVTAPAGITDTDSSNDSATDVDAVRPVPPTDVAVTKSDGTGEVSCGATTVYTITASNVGTLPVAAVRVIDDFPEPLACTWTCAGSGGAACVTAEGTGDIDQTVGLPVDSAVTFSASCRVDADFDGSLANTARATITSGGPDELPDNNSATDTDTVQCDDRADLSVTKSDGVTAVPAGEAVTYTITAANAGPDEVTGARVIDVFPLGLSCEWTCAAAGGAACGDAAGAGNLDEPVSLPPGGTATFTAVCAVGPFAPDELSNTATISVPPGFIDPVPANDSATDVDVVLRVSDLTVTKTADRELVTVGESLQYTITVANAGPSGSAPVQVTDAFPGGLSCTWVCTGTASGVCGQPEGVGDIVQGLSLAPGHSVTYVVDCTVTPEASGTLVNTATAANRPGWVDPVPGDNSATVEVDVTAFADLSITKTDSLAQAQAGQPIEYTIEVANAGPDDAAGVRVLDPQPPNLLGVTWACGAESGNGDLEATLDLPAGSSVTCVVAGTVRQGFCGPLENVATVVAPAGVIDTVPGNDVAADQTPVFPLPANGPPPLVNLCASKALLTGPHPPGSTVIYRIQLFNGGPGPLLDGPLPELVDDLPPELSNVVAQADAGSVAVLPGGQLIWNGDVAPGEVVTITITGTVDGVVGQVVSNQGLFGDPNIPPVVPTDDPDTPEPLDPTEFTIAGALEIPALGLVGLALLAALLAAAGLRRLSSLTPRAGASAARSVLRWRRSGRRDGRESHPREGRRRR